MKEIVLMPEVEEFISDPDFERMVRYLAIQFGKEMTLEGLNEEIQNRKPMPTKIIDGKEYVAGYSGRFMVPMGPARAKLVDMQERGGQCKLLFTIGNVFLYHTIEIDFDQIIKTAKQIGKEFDVVVGYTTIKNTGNRHAAIARVFWDSQDAISVEVSAE